MDKSEKAPTSAGNRKNTQPLELILTYVMATMSTVSLYGKKYGVGIIDYFTAKSELLSLSHKPETFEEMREYKLRSKRATGFKLQTVPYC